VAHVTDDKCAIKRDARAVTSLLWSLPDGFQITFCPIGFYRNWRARFSKKRRGLSKSADNLKSLAISSRHVRSLIHTVFLLFGGKGLQSILRVLQLTAKALGLSNPPMFAFPCRRGNRVAASW
jgi:hypothetical protein